MAGLGESNTGSGTGGGGNQSGLVQTKERTFAVSNNPVVTDSSGGVLVSGMPGGLTGFSGLSLVVGVDKYGNSGSQSKSWGSFNENLSQTLDNFQSIGSTISDVADSVLNPTITTDNTFDLGGTSKGILMLVGLFIVGKMFKWF